MSNQHEPGDGMTRTSLPVTLSITEAGRLLGYGRDTAYDAARRGVLPTVLVGRRKRRVPTHRLLELLDGKPGVRQLEANDQGRAVAHELDVPSRE
jgi:excisionase family DNA binding protein